MKLLQLREETIVFFSDRCHVVSGVEGEPLQIGKRLGEAFFSTAKS